MDWNDILSYAVKKVDKSIKLKDSLFYYPSFVIGYKINGDNYLRKMALKITETLGNCKKYFNFPLQRLLNIFL